MGRRNLCELEEKGEDPTRSMIDRNLATPSEQQGMPPEGGQGPGKDMLKLRLDINLDVDLRISARVHGDVTLSLL